MKLLTSPEMRERALLNAAVGANHPEDTAILHLIGEYARDVDTLLGLLRKADQLIRYLSPEIGREFADEIRAILAGQEKS